MKTSQYNPTKFKQVFNGFIDSMYFADGADSDFKNEDGFYEDGIFNKQGELSQDAIKNIIDLLDSILPSLPTEVYNLDLERIGMCIYYDIQGHGVGFDDEELCDDTKKELYDLLAYKYNLEIYDNDSSNEIEFTYWTKGV